MAIRIVPPKNIYFCPLGRRLYSDCHMVCSGPRCPKLGPVSISVCPFHVAHRNNTGYHVEGVQNGATQISLVKVFMANRMRLHKGKKYALSCRRIQFAINTFTIEIWVAPFCTPLFRTKKMSRIKIRRCIAWTCAKVRNPDLNAKNTYGKLNAPTP